MKNVEYLIGSAEISSAPLPPYSEEALAFCAELSKTLLRSPLSRTYPDISALAFWCRRANLLRLQENCPEAAQRLGRGLCFHVTPGNIPINFAFSYLFGLLAGCSNIVRLPSKRFPQTSVVCDAIAETLTRHPEIQSRTAFIRYPADDETTAYFCKQADARLIWGGDTTVASVRNQPSSPRCVDVCFADRYSIALLNGEAILKTNDEEIARLADDFYNDTYLMDQNACSSPQIMFWQQDSAEARERFWNAVYAAAERKYQLQAAVGVDKYTHMFEDILDQRPIQNITKQSNLLYRVELSGLSGELTELRGKGGYFYEYRLETLEELVPHITEKYQTITYFGMDPENLRRFVVGNRLRGVDRIVPIGKAMDIGIVWDGFDLARVLSRYISLE